MGSTTLTTAAQAESTGSGTGTKGDKGDSGIGAVLQLKTAMRAGVLTYVLPSIPPYNSVMAFMNGLEVSYTLSGAELTITEYSANEIENTDLLTVFY